MWLPFAVKLICSVFFLRGRSGEPCSLGTLGALGVWASMGVGDVGGEDQYDVDKNMFMLCFVMFYYVFLLLLFKKKKCVCVVLIMLLF